MTHGSPYAPHTFSVLVVDDDRWTTKAISLALKDEPAIGRVVAAHDGREALEVFGTLCPDVVLMDLNMAPGMSGIEAIERIRMRNPLARIVVLTTVSPGPGLARALDAGAMAIVRKTASDASLRAVVLGAARGDDPRLLKSVVYEIILSGDPLPDAPAVVPRLTVAERAILLLVAQGLGYEEIAERQRITVWTARSHVKRIREKLYAENLAQLVVRAMQYHYISS